MKNNKRQQEIANKEKLIIENFHRVSEQLGMETKQKIQFVSAIEAYKNSNDGDEFEMYVTNPNPVTHHSGNRNNEFTSHETVVKIGDFFVPKTDINLDSDLYKHGRRVKREYSPEMLDKNNKQILLVKL